MIKCAFNGEKGAYAEMAVKKYFAADAEPFSVNSFENIFEAVINGTCDFGMVPIENSTAGCVYQNYDNFTKYKDVQIAVALVLKIEHALLAPKGADINSIKTVYSHPQALYQCHDFIRQHNFKEIDTISTATGAILVSQQNDITKAAIANSINAEIYNLKIIKNGIQDNTNNFTRFFIISSVKNKTSKEFFACTIPNKASFTFTTKDEPGALYDCLGIFKNAGFNLKRIESRPVPESPWKYRFFTDVELECGSYVEAMEWIEKFMNEMKSVCEDVRMLGGYEEKEM